MAETKQDNAAAYGKMVAKAWRDPAFKAKLLADPHAALKDAGISVPAGVTVKVVENTDTDVHFVLPPKPTRELSDEALDTVTGGWQSCTPETLTTGLMFWVIAQCIGGLDAIHAQGQREDAWKERQAIAENNAPIVSIGPPSKG